MLDFQNAKVLSMSIENKFFGDTFRYASHKNLTVQGSLYNLTNQSGVEGIWSGISGVVNSSNDYDDIQLRGVSFGKGRIENIRFAEGKDVRQKDFTVSLTIFSTGNLFNMTGSYYSGADFSSGHLLENFSENFNFQVDQEDNYSYEQSVNCRFISNGGNTNTIPIAQNFARSLLQQTLPFGFFTSQYSGFYNESGRRLYKESYNLISSECSFTESFRLPATRKGNYSVRFDYQVNTDEKGITTVQEHASILGLVEPLYTSAEEGFDAESVGAFSRCQGEFAAYAPSGARPLNQTRISLQKRVNLFEGTIDYSVVYNNDPVLESGNNYSWEYTQEIRRDNCVNQVSERGKVKGLSTTCTFADRYTHALAGYATVKSGIPTRLATFAGVFGVGSIREISFSEERSEFQGEISYSATYTDSLIATSTMAIRKVETEITDNMPVALINQFIAMGFGGRTGKELIQPTNNSTPGERSVAIKVFGIRATARSVLLTEAKTRLNQNIPTQNDPFVTSCGYVYEPKTNTVTARATWKFFSTWAFEDVTVS